MFALPAFRVVVFVVGLPPGQVPPQGSLFPWSGVQLLWGVWRAGKVRTTAGLAFRPELQVQHVLICKQTWSYRYTANPNSVWGWTYPPGVAQKPHTQHTSLPVTHPGLPPSPDATIIWYWSSKSVTELQSNSREIWHYFTSKNNCLFPWETMTESTLRGEVKAHHDLSMPVGKWTGRISIDWVLTVSQSTSKCILNLWKKDKRSFSSLLVITKHCLHWQLTEKTVIAIFMISHTFCLLFSMTREFITCHHHRRRCWGLLSCAYGCVSLNTNHSCQRAGLFPLLQTICLSFKGGFTIWYGIIFIMALNTVKNRDDLLAKIDLGVSFFCLM